MTYMNVNTINFDDLDEGLEDILQKMAGDDLYVLITSGDESYQESFAMPALSLAEVLEEISENECIVFAESAPELDGFTKGKSYFGEEKLTKND